ncbi:protein PHYTOCHROME KINASE SUBSTRATE 3-like [Daucus carota subsp. sativus]
MDGEDIYSHLRVASFSCYLDSAEESFVPELTEEFPVPFSPVESHNDSNDKNGVCTRCSTILACEGTCLEKQADRGLHGMIQPQPGKKNAEQFSFPVLNLRKENPKGKKHVIAEIGLQGATQNSVGSGMTKKDDIAVKLARKLSRLTWDAIPNTQSRSLIPASSGSSSWCDDTASDDSSDLFEIENTPSTRCSMLSRQEPSALSKTQNSADKPLTVETSSTSRTTKPKDSCKLRSGALWLLGCKSSHAVRIEENTVRIRESAKGGRK